MSFSLTRNADGTVGTHLCRTTASSITLCCTPHHVPWPRVYFFSPLLTNQCLIMQCYLFMSTQNDGRKNIHADTIETSQH